jgi:hypothetical protein
MAVALGGAGGCCRCGKPPVCAATFCPHYGSGDTPLPEKLLCRECAKTPVITCTFCAITAVSLRDVVRLPPYANVSEHTNQVEAAMDWEEEGADYARDWQLAEERDRATRLEAEAGAADLAADLDEVADLLAKRRRL